MQRLVTIRLIDKKKNSNRFQRMGIKKQRKDLTQKDLIAIADSLAYFSSRYRSLVDAMNERGITVISAGNFSTLERSIRFIQKAINVANLALDEAIMSRGVFSLNASPGSAIPEDTATDIPDIAPNAKTPEEAGAAASAFVNARGARPQKADSAPPPDKKPRQKGSRK